MQRNIRRLVSGTALVAVSVTAFPIRTAAAATTQYPEIVSSSDDDPVARRRCRWVVGHGLVCDTPISTVNI